MTKLQNSIDSTKKQEFFIVNGCPVKLNFSQRPENNDVVMDNIKRMMLGSVTKK